MTSIGFIVRKLLKSIGVCNKQNHDITASRLVHLVSEKEETLGCNSWEDIREGLHSYEGVKRRFEIIGFHRILRVRFAYLSSVIKSSTISLFHF